jgi:hypothetical protein
LFSADATVKDSAITPTRNIARILFMSIPPNSNQLPYQ